ncbi:BlaI/MecI/CopY family transcriptional regulator [Pirellulaceae bacterium SH449]
MNNPPRDVTAAELAIMEQLWEQGAQTAKELSRTLYGAETPSDIGTVQKLLSRLEDKGCVDRDRGCWPHLFRPILTRDELISQRLQATADELCDGALTSLLSYLVKSTKFTSKQRQSLRNLLDDLDKK